VADAFKRSFLDSNRIGIKSQWEKKMGRSRPPNP
jgi:hypothetical protein